MEVLDIFSWLPAKEMSLEQLEKIFEEYFNGTYRGEYTTSIETPCNIGKNILNCRAELMEGEIVYRNEKNELSIHKLKKRQNMY